MELVNRGNEKCTNLDLRRRSPSGFVPDFSEVFLDAFAVDVLDDEDLRRSGGFASDSEVRPYGDAPAPRVVPSRFTFASARTGTTAASSLGSDATSRIEFSCSSA